MFIKDVPVLAKKTDFLFSLCSFLDFYKLSNKKTELLLEEPLKGVLNIEEVSILAAVAHKLANDDKFEPPQWVYKKEYILPTPMYAYNTKNKDYQEYLKNTSPKEFSQRNLFVGENAIDRA